MLHELPEHLVRSAGTATTDVMLSFDELDPEVQTHIERLVDLLDSLQVGMKAAERSGQYDHGSATRDKMRTILNEIDSFWLPDEAEIAGRLADYVERSEGEASIARAKAIGAAALGALPRLESTKGMTDRRPDFLSQHEWIPGTKEQQAARVAFPLGMKWHGLRDEPVLRWHKPNGQCSGYYLPGDRARPPEIWVQVGMSPTETAETVLHELTHAKQFERGDPVVGMGFSDRRLEIECEVTARYLTKKLEEQGSLP